jgi:GH24 family phage-related lysozyme (muramidase)
VITPPELHPKTFELLFEFEGKPRLTARLCEGNRYEVAYGVTYDLNDVPFKKGDTITEDQVMPLTLYALRKEAAPVWNALTRDITAYQAGALACLAFNIGGSAAAKSSVVRHLNDGRYEDAAAAFGMWTGATSPGPSPSEIAAGIAPSFPEWSKATGRWTGPDGKPCMYFRRFRGLLRRHHAEGCMFLGLDWREAVKNDAIELATEAVWNAAKGRWEDRIVRQTEFAAVLAVARKHPLQAATIAQEPDPPVAAPTVPVKVKPLPEIKPEPPVEVLPPPPIPKEKPVTVPKPAQLPYGSVEPIKDPKDMLASKRFWGLVIMIFSRFSFLGLSTQTWAGELAGDPILLDAASAGLAMGAIFLVDASGQLLHWYGKRDAKAFLK